MTGPPLDPRHLAAVAALWQREEREITASFAGGSMLPTIRPGDPIRLRFTRDCAIGDVVLSIVRERITLHRLIARGPRWLLTQGDANYVPDPPITADNILARVVDGDPGPPSTFRRPRARLVIQRSCIGAMRLSQALGTRVIALFLIAQQRYAGRAAR